MAKTASTDKPRKIMQTELAEFTVLRSSTEKFKELREDLIDRYKKGADQEAGELSLHVNTDDGTSVSYKSALDALVEKHPTMTKEVGQLIRKFTKPKTSNEVVIVPGTTV